MPPNQQHVVMVASENGALAGGKVGGVGDVVRSLPKALASLGWRVTVITPAYGFLHHDSPSSLTTRVTFPFRGEKMDAEIWSAKSAERMDGVDVLLVEHPSIRGNPIYFDEPSGSPYMRDATKYALFCSAVGQYLKTFQRPFVLHLHDWHAATLLFLRSMHPSFDHLKPLRTAFTIHNLSFQGSRPMVKHDSSLETWFPELFKSTEWISAWSDPRYAEPVFTPMAVAIRCADRVNAVSPTYAREILIPNNREAGFHGGEGLELLLQQAQHESRLAGILNGCDYPENRVVPRLSFSQLCDLIVEEVKILEEKDAYKQMRWFAERLQRLRVNPPAILLTSVTRVVEQKVGLLLEQDSSHTAALAECMNILDRCNGLYILLGNGTSDYVQRLTEASRTHERFLFIHGYAERLSEALYANGTMYLMPSMFEPCGISQMLAMRDGQPCLVHAVGGLRDTVMGGVNGFIFYGATMEDKVENFLSTLSRAVEFASQNTALWEKITIGARKARFTWEQSAKRYVQQMYT